METVIGALSKYERRTLAEMANFRYESQPYYWREASVAKLVKRGLAEPHPKYPRAFRLTAAGRAAYEALP